MGEEIESFLAILQAFQALSIEINKRNGQDSL
jgi:hypothetical protein